METQENRNYMVKETKVINVTEIVKHGISEDDLVEYGQEVFNVFNFEPGNIGHLELIQDILKIAQDMTKGEIADYQG